MILNNKTIVLLLFALTAHISAQGQRYMEDLDRGLNAVRINSSHVLISWRMTGEEYNKDATYNLYKSGELLASDLLVSNYVDTTTESAQYAVSVIIDGEEGEISSSENVKPNFYFTVPITPPAGGKTPLDDPYTYSANDASVADLDGDGQYEIVLKWSPSNAKDNAQGGFTGPIILEGLELDGTSLWRINLGINIRSGEHYNPFMVYDLNNDGKAEVACKTADGTQDGLGYVIGDSTQDYRTSNGYILSGPEFLTVFDGETGKAIHTVDYYPARGVVSAWGDDYGNRVDRFLACIAYLDGETPSLVMCRGYYTRTVLAAYDFNGENLTERWIFDTDLNGLSSYRGQGNHNLAVGDVDGDGKDEIMYGACAIDHDGSGLYSTGFGHGDAGHLADIDPDVKGLEYFMPHESANGTTRPGISMRDAGTGEILFSVMNNGDIGRGVAANIDSNHRGLEMWASNGSGLHDKNGEPITGTLPKSTGGANSYNFCAWWDGDVEREILDRGVLNKWNPTTYGSGRLVTLYNIEGASTNNGTKSVPCLVADILGDWREEIIMRNSSSTKLIIFTTNGYTTERMYTLMHDPVYRLSIAWQNVGYNQPPHLGFFFEGGDTKPPKPDIITASSNKCESSKIKPSLRINGEPETLKDTISMNQGSAFEMLLTVEDQGKLEWIAGNENGDDTRINLYPETSGKLHIKFKSDTGCTSQNTYFIDVSKISQTLLNYEMESGADSTILDASGSQNHGQAFGGVSFKAGKVNNAISFDGNNDYIELPAAIIDQSKELTIATWINPENTEAGAHILHMSLNDNRYLSLSPKSEGDHKVTFSITKDGTPNLKTVSSSSELANNTWTHLAVTLKGGKASIYLNGQLSSTNENFEVSPADLDETVFNYIGKTRFSDPLFKGMLDDFVIYNYAMNATQIGYLMNRNLLTNQTIIQESQNGLCDFSGIIDKTTAGYTDEGFINSDNVVDTEASWKVDIKSPGMYKFKWRYHTERSAPANIYFDGNFAGTIPFTDTKGEWYESENGQLTITLQEGQYQISLKSISTAGLADLDYLKIEGIDAITAVSCSSTLNSNTDIPLLNIYPNPAQGSQSLNIELNQPAYEVSILDMKGSKIRSIVFQKPVTSYTLNTNLEPGLYILSVKTDNDEIRSKVLISK